MRKVLSLILLSFALSAANGIEKVHFVANDTHLLAFQAESLEKRLRIKPWPKDKDRCGASARAVIQTLGPNSPVDFSAMKRGAHALANEILQNHDSKEQWIYYGDSYRFDHVFVIYKDDTGHYAVLQSFVNSYSLKKQLETLNWMSLEEMVLWLEKLEKIDSTQNCSLEILRLFEELFSSPMHETIQTDYNELDSDFSYLSIQITTPL